MLRVRRKPLPEMCNACGKVIDEDFEEVSPVELDDSV